MLVHALRAIGLNCRVKRFLIPTVSKARPVEKRRMRGVLLQLFAFRLEVLYLSIRVFLSILLFALACF